MNLPIIDNCDDCGVCCYVGHPLFVRSVVPRKHGWIPSGSQDEEAYLRLPADLKKEVDDHLMALVQSGIADDGQPCHWLDLKTMACKHYEHRPLVCREFEPGSEGCRYVRECHGISD
jgi:Fe-S-cluster containining protein